MFFFSRAYGPVDTLPRIRHGPDIGKADLKSLVLRGKST